jgi:serine/threonine protein kinase
VTAHSACVFPPCAELGAATATPSARLCEGCGRPLGGPSFGPRPGYRVEAFLGSGYYADVFRARDLGSGEAYAAKIYRRDPTKRQAAAREIEALHRLAHPRLPALRAWFDEGEWFFVVMELVEGANLRQEVETHGPLSASRTVEMGIEACQVFGYIAAQGWTYRDLHPKNIHRETPKGTMLVDLDGARPPGWPARPSGRIGYRAPELDGDRPMTPAGDVYSLVGCLYFALTGEDPPTRPGPLPDRRGQLGSSAGLADLLDECRRADPARRPTVEALRAVLERWSDG